MPQIRHNSAAGGAKEGAKLIHEHLTDQTTDDLLDDLSDWLANADGTHFDSENLNAILSALDEINPESEEFHPEESLAAFHQRFEPVFDKEENSSPSSALARHPRHFSRRLIQVAAIIVVMLFSMVTAQAFGFDIFGAIAKWTSSTFHFSDKEAIYATIGTYPIDDGEQQTYDSLQAALDDFGVVGEIAPTWVPERFQLKIVTAQVKKAGISIESDYAGSNGEYLSITIRNYDSSKQTEIEKDADNTDVYITDDIIHYLVSDKSFEKATWINGQLECKVIGNITYPELKEIIDSIYRG
ncbi:DUF4367 domain-containing protein [Oscillibacter sp.]|uniref:DUF4367 domain-containing protein n=1 Tax=Oscillibacter sp. TaxID=1945593 RepID=UPI00339AD7B1